MSKRWEPSVNCFMEDITVNHKMLCVVSAAKKTAKNKRKWLTKSRSFLPEVRTPDQLESGWQYRLSVTVGQQAVWTNDDSTLRVEALKGSSNTPPFVTTVHSSLIDFSNKIVWTLLIDNDNQCAVKIVVKHNKENIEIIGKSVSPSLDDLEGTTLWKLPKVSTL